MNGKSTISIGRDAIYARDDAPRLTREIAEHAELAVGGHVIKPARPRGRPRKSSGERKEAVSLRLSPAVLAHFRSTGAGWQTRIDEALQAFVGGVGQVEDRRSESVHEEQAGFRGGEPAKRGSTGRR